MTALLDSPYKVLELGDSISASACGMFLRQAGAQVTKIEPLQRSPILTAPPLVAAELGAPISTLYAYLNNGKRRIVADIETRSGREHIERLIETESDVILMSGTRDEWIEQGMPPSRVLELAPKAVIGRITAFGDDGPYKDMAGGELQFQALGGLMHVVGKRDREPLRLGGYAAQYSAGASLFTGVLLGLYRLHTQGIGGEVSTSVFETVPYIEWKNAVAFQANGVVPTRGDEGSPVILPCRDGFSAFFYMDYHWDAVVTLFGDRRLLGPDFSTESLRHQHRAELVDLLTENSMRWRKKDLYHRGQSLGIPIGYFATMGDLLESEQYKATALFEEIKLGDVGIGIVPGASWKVVDAPETGAQPP